MEDVRRGSQLPRQPLQRRPRCHQLDGKASLAQRSDQSVDLAHGRLRTKPHRHLDFAVEACKQVLDGRGARLSQAQREERDGQREDGHRVGKGLVTNSLKRRAPEDFRLGDRTHLA